MKIAEYLSKTHSHPTAEEVYNEVKKDLPAITLATVYRNLNVLVEEGKALRFVVGKEYHYDNFHENHQHFVCEKCGNVVDVKNPKMTEYAMKNFDMKGFKPKTVRLIFRGLCPDCDE